MPWLQRLAALAVAFFAAVCPASAADSEPIELLRRLFVAPAVTEQLFAPSFLGQVSADEVRRIVEGLESRHGPLKAVRPEGGAFVVVLERAEVPARLVLDGDGRIAGLWFGAPAATGGTIRGWAEEIAALPGRTAVLVATDGAARVSTDAGTPLAVGSAAKLAILAALKEAVEAGPLSWEQVVTLEERWRSLPTGILQAWPAGTPLTIATLANLMISISDNTATDALLDIVGRDAASRFAPANEPFLSTRDLFVLKGSGSDRLRAVWRRGRPEERRTLPAELARHPLPESLVAEPTTDIEWFLSAEALCALLERTASLPVFAINPGLADPRRWSSVTFKGGSETGVLNLSTRLVAPDGTTHCVVATWNGDQTLDEDRLTAPYRAILKALE